MKIKDKYGSRITLYQAKSGEVILAFGEQAIGLTKEQAEALCSPYDLEDFDFRNYRDFYA